MVASLTRDLIIEKLSTVYDPEIPVNIWELADEIVQQVHDVVMEVEGIEAVTVNLVFEPAWTPERMSEVAKLELGYNIWGKEGGLQMNLYL